MTDELACVRTFANRHEAELARGALEASGIEALVAADDAGGEVPGLDFPRGVGVFVRAEDLAAARAALRLSE